MRSEKGFTLIELLLSVAILALVAGFSLPFYVSFQTRNELDTTTNQMVDMLRRAQSYARNGNGDGSQWGVAVQGDAVTLFKGTTYATRDSAVDEIMTLPRSVNPGGLSEVSFTKLKGVPSQPGVFNLASSVGTTRTITLNAAGMVSY